MWQWHEKNFFAAFLIKAIYFLANPLFGRDCNKWLVLIFPERKASKAAIYEKPDSFIVARAPQRGGALAKTSASTRQNIGTIYVLYFFFGNMKLGRFDHEKGFEQFSFT